MIVQVSSNVFYGDKPSVVEGLDKFKAVLNVAHSIRRPYWEDLGKLPWEVWYLRLALPDREPADLGYILAMENFLDSLETSDKFPLLCHCRAGGHRGPTAAFFAAWYLDGKHRCEFWEDKMRDLIPGWDKHPERRVYRQSIITYCRAISEGINQNMLEFKGK